MNAKFFLTLAAIVVVGVGFYYFLTLKQSDSELPSIANDTRVKGMITKEPMLGKKDKVIEGQYDYFFEVSENEWYFIHIEKSNVNKELLEMFVDKEVTVRGYAGEGQWDSDDPEDASRIGPYIVIKNIFQ